MTTDEGSRKEKAWITNITNPHESEDEVNSRCRDLRRRARVENVRVRCWKTNEGEFVLVLVGTTEQLRFDVR